MSGRLHKHSTMSKALLCLTWFSVVFVRLAGADSALEAVLPQGDAPAPIVSRRFPDRVHEFVWRNWNAVEPTRLARILGATVPEIRAVADSMGLPSAGPVPPELKERGYITLIRRNWHLLPYEQLLELLEMTPERLAFALREDDFLWVKLGRLKPKCEPLRYHKPDETTRKRAEEIRGVVRENFGDEMRRPAEPRFDFVRQLSAPLQSSDRKLASDQSHLLRLVYSYLAVYGDPLSNPKLDPYPDGFLERLSAVGVNGVWLHVVLRDLAPGGTAFPEFGADHAKRLTNLRALVQRAKKFGIRVYLYLNEPRAMPTAFFKDRSEIRRRPGRTRRIPSPLHLALRGASVDGRCIGACVSSGAGLRWRIRDHCIGKPDQLCFAWRLARLSALPGASDYGHHQ